MHHSFPANSIHLVDLVLTRFSLLSLSLSFSLSRMVWPALTENFRAAVGLPRATPYLPSRAKYALEEVDQMPVKKA